LDLELLKNDCEDLKEFQTPTRERKKRSFQIRANEKYGQKQRKYKCETSHLLTLNIATDFRGGAKKEWLKK